MTDLSMTDLSVGGKCKKLLIATISDKIEFDLHLNPKLHLIT